MKKLIHDVKKNGPQKEAVSVRVYLLLIYSSFGRAFLTTMFLPFCSDSFN